MTAAKNARNRTGAAVVAKVNDKKSFSEQNKPNAEAIHGNSNGSEQSIKNEALPKETSEESVARSYSSLKESETQEKSGKVCSLEEQAQWKAHLKWAEAEHDMSMKLQPSLKAAESSANPLQCTWKQGKMCVDQEVCRQHSSGAQYRGSECGGKKSGWGKFTWPFGTWYDGEFVEDKRHGKGVQVWTDGSRYDGYFDSDCKHGCGTFVWCNGETYSGSFYRDHCHGYGVYTWCSGSSYTGMFYMDKREGYGTFQYPDGVKFQGLYRGGERYGPGVQTYVDGKQDVGIWLRERLIRLLTVSEFSTFSIRDVTGITCDEIESKHLCVLPLPPRPSQRGVIMSLAQTLSKELRELQQQQKEFYEQLGLEPPEEPEHLGVNQMLLNKSLLSEELPVNSLAIDLMSYDSAFRADIQKLQNKAQKTSQENDESRQKNSAAEQDEPEIIKMEKTKDDHVEVDNNEIHQDSNHKSKSEEENEAEDNSSIEKPNSPAESEIKPKFKSEVKSEVKSGVKPDVTSEVNVDVDSGESSGMGGVIERSDSTVSVCNMSNRGALSRNNASEFLRMQAHTAWHYQSHGYLNFNIDAILECKRSEFGLPGYVECASGRLLKAAAQGDIGEVQRLLDSKMADPDVADSSGSTAILNAATNLRLDVVNCLLDHGANVNSLTDEHISSLGACCVLLFPPSSFRSTPLLPFTMPPDTDTTSSDMGAKQKPGGAAGKKPPAEEKKGKETNVASGKGNKNQNASIAEKDIKKNKRSGKLTSAESRRVSELKQKYSSNDIRRRTSLVGVNNSAIPRAEQIKTEPEEEVVQGSVPETRTIGRLQIKRAERSSVVELLNGYGFPLLPLIPPVIQAEEEFDSARCVYELSADPVSDRMIVRSARLLSRNSYVEAEVRASGSNSRLGQREREVKPATPQGTVYTLAMEKCRARLLRRMIRLLLSRGADPNASLLPMSSLLYPVLAGDVELVGLILARAADPDARTNTKMGSYAALHISCSMPDPQGVCITRLLLEAGADPNITTTSHDVHKPDEKVKTTAADDGEIKVNQSRVVSQAAEQTPLHITCARFDNYAYVNEIVEMLLHYGAKVNPRTLSDGYTPLNLAILAGNDQAVHILLRHGADVNLLADSRFLCSALCTTIRPECEPRRSASATMTLIDKLVSYGADTALPIPVGPSNDMGTVVDYAFYIYGEDKRISNTPYHALTPKERETFTSRQKILEHLANVLRCRVVEREAERLLEELRFGTPSRSPSAKFLYTGSGNELKRDGATEAGVGEGLVGVSGGKTGTTTGSQDDVRRPLFRYCYNCGRSLYVKLTPCSRCKEVFYCSRDCMLKSWEARHKDECLRVPKLDAKSSAEALRTSNHSLHSRQGKYAKKVGNGSNNSSARGTGRGVSVLSARTTARGSVGQIHTAGSRQRSIQWTTDIAALIASGCCPSWMQNLPSHCYVGNYSFV